jgi:hypothetical protein
MNIQVARQEESLNLGFITRSSDPSIYGIVTYTVDSWLVRN